MDWLENIFLVQGDLLATFLRFMGFAFVLIVILEGFYIIKSAFRSVF